MGISSIIKSATSAIQKVPIPKSLTKVGIKLEKHAPDIMVIGGTILIIGSAVYACKKTLDARDIIEEATEDIKKINYGQDVAEGNAEFDAKIARKERMNVYSNAGFELAKCYGPSLIGGVTGFALIFGAHNIQKERNAVLAAAYTNLLASYKNYRDRVRNELGENRDVAFASGATIEDGTTLDANDDIQPVENAMVIHDDGSQHSIYARVFDEANINWQRNPGSNLTFIKSIQNFANDKLRSEGVVFLNDVYHMLGFPRTSEGQIVGWVWDPNDESRDNYIDFGIYDSVYTSAVIRDFINGIEPCVWLDFNVDGVVYDLI